MGELRDFRGTLEHAPAARLNRYRLRPGGQRHLFEAAMAEHYGDDAGEGPVLTEPATGRMYAHWNGDDTTFETDRNRAEEWQARHNATVRTARENRAWVLRAVRHATGEGISQFIDVGAGPPMNPSVAGTARVLIASARVVYVDNDPAITAHSLAVDARGAGITAVTGDARDAAALFTDLTQRAVIDPREPVCVLLAAVLHYMPPDQAKDAAGQMRSLIAPGSLMAISVGIASPEVAAEFSKVMGAQVTGYAHTREQVAGYFDGLDLLDPGLVWAREWRPDTEIRDGSEPYILAGVGRRP